MQTQSTERSFGNLRVARLETREALAALRPEWEDLLDRTDVATPFLTPEWQQAWLDTYGVSHRLFVLTVRQGDELVGLWPLGLKRRHVFRVLEPLGAGRSDWLDILACPTRRPAVVSALVHYLNAERGAWDLIELRDVRADSPTIGALEALTGPGSLRLRRAVRTVAPFAALDRSWDDYLKTRSANFRSTVRRRVKKAADPKTGLTVKMEEAPDPERLVDELAEVERRSWKAQEGTLKLTTAIGREFYKRFCAELAGRGELRVWTATVDGVVIAYLVNFVRGGKTYFYNGAYDERQGDLSPGTVLHAAAIEDSIRHGVTEYDFLSGDEPYKDRWATGRRDIYHLTLHSARPASLAAQGALVEFRWALKRSAALKAGRARLLTAVRRIVRRRPAVQEQQS